MATNINVSIRYSSFLPVLMEVMNRTDGDVLELGPGVFSTPVLHWMCETQDRKLLSIENDKMWFRFCSQYFRTENHQFLYVDDWDKCREAINKPWDVALIDHSPSERRIEEIKFLADKVKFMVVHDSQPWKDHQYRYSSIYPLFKYKFDFNEVEHHTVLLSNFVNLEDFSIYHKPKMTFKNLLIYINPDKAFAKEHEDLTKIQIDNSLALGWKIEDIMLVTNFDYEYKGVKAVVVGEYQVIDQNRSTKIPAIIELFDSGLIQENEIYWFHDHDAFQLIPFDIKLDRDSAFSVYRDPQIWNAGSFFFKKEALDIFKKIWELMNLRNTNEQDALTYMWQNNIDDINDRYELLNITYNMGLDNLKNHLSEADVPLKVAHFHPHKKKHLELFRDILPERLLEIFKNYDIS